MIQQRKSGGDAATTSFFHNLSYVGCISSNYFLAQHEQNLYLINSIPVCLEVFPWLILSNLTRLSVITLDPPIDLRECLLQFLQQHPFTEQEIQRHTEKLDTYIAKIVSCSDFLSNLFQIKIQGTYVS